MRSSVHVLRVHVSAAARRAVGARTGRTVSWIRLGYLEKNHEHSVDEELVLALSWLIMMSASGDLPAQRASTRDEFRVLSLSFLHGDWMGMKDGLPRKSGRQRGVQRCVPCC